MTPGNFVFYDLFQYSIGSCTADEIAVAMACQVAGKYQDGRKLLVHGGAIHYSKESLPPPGWVEDHVTGGQPFFGQVVYLEDTGWFLPSTAIYLTAISQEHGILERSGDFFDSVNIGDTIHILPVHSCLTANLMGAYKTPDGKMIETINTDKNGIHTH
jgi:D-serine deaminase-like pyridoxal phosphate-dependent protein